MDERTRYAQLTEDQRTQARTLATASPIGFWEAVDYLAAAGWDPAQAQIRMEADYTFPGLRRDGARFWVEE
jgi:selenocysteine lyase/cysteine desulfurase